MPQRGKVDETYTITQIFLTKFFRLYVVDIQNFLLKKYAAGKAAVHYKDITEKSFLSMEELCLG